MSVGFLAGRMTTPEPAGGDSNENSKSHNTENLRVDAKTSAPQFTGARRFSSSTAQSAPAEAGAPTFQDLDTIMNEVDGHDIHSKTYELSRSIPPDDIKRWVIEVDSRKQWRYGGYFVDQLLRRWAETDPSAALDYAMSHIGKGSHRHRLASVVAVWAKHDFNTTAAWWRALPEGTTKTMALHGLTQSLGSLVKLDPEAALEFAMSLKSSSVRNSAMQVVARAWAMQDYDSAVAWWRGLPEGGEKRQALYGLTQFYGHNAKSGFEKPLKFAMSLPGGESRNRAIQHATGAWARQDFNAVVAWVRDLPEGGDQRRIMTSLAQHIGTFALEDPEGAMAFALSLPNSESRNQALQNTGRTWAGTDLNAALKALMTLEPGRQQNVFMQGLCHEWTTHDPQAAAVFASTLPKGQYTENILNQIASSWATTDIGGALEWAESLDPGNTRNEIISSIAQQWSQHEPEAAIAYYSEMSGGRQRNQVLTSIASQWMQHDVSAAITWLVEQPAKIRVDVISSASYQLARNQPAFTAEICKTMLPPGQHRQSIMGQIARYWAMYDMPGVTDWIQTLESPQESKNAFSSICSKWAEDDPEAAAAFVFKVENTRVRNEMLKKLATDWSRNDPAKAIAWAELLNDEGTRNQALCNIAQGISHNNPEMATDIISRLPEGTTKENAVTTTLSNWIANDPVSAMKWLDSFPESDLKWRATAQAAQRWAYDDPSAAAELALSIPEENQQSSTMANVMRQWGRNDAISAGLFLQEFNSGKIRDAAVQSYCDSIVQYYPGMAAEWAESIENESLRNSQMQSVAQQWIRTDSELAAEWIASSSLPESTRARLLADANKQ